MNAPQRWGMIGLAIAALTYGILSCHYIDRVPVSSDESYIAVASRNAMEGKIPYRDFAYTQGPLLPYINGAAMELVGFGLMEQRAMNVAWGAVGLTALVIGLWCRSGALAGALAVLPIVTAPYWVTFQTMGKTYGVSGAFAAMAVGTYLVPKVSLVRGLLFVALSAIAVGSRLSAVAVLLPLGLGLVAEQKSWKGQAVLIGSAVGAFVILIFPFIALAPEAAVFNLWAYHMGGAWNRRGEVLGEWAMMAPAALLIIGTAGVCIPGAVKRRELQPTMMGIAAILGVTLPVWPRGSYGDYIIPTVAPACALAVAVLADGGWLKPRTSVLMVALTGLVFIFPLPEETEGVSRPVKEAAAYLNEQKMSGPILTPWGIVAVEAGLPIWPGTDMGSFSAMGPDEDLKAGLYKTTTVPRLAEAVSRKGPMAIVFISDDRHNFEWVNPTLKPQAPETTKLLVEAVGRHYRLSKRVGLLGVFLPNGEAGSPEGPEGK